MTNDRCFICKKQVSDDCIMVTLEDYGLRYICNQECLDDLIDRLERESQEIHQYVETT